MSEEFYKSKTLGAGTNKAIVRYIKLARETFEENYRLILVSGTLIYDTALDILPFVAA